MIKTCNVKLGATYRAKVTNKLADVRIDTVNAAGGWDATNLATQKKIRIKSGRRLRELVEDTGTTTATPEATPPPVEEPVAEAAETPQAAPSRTKSRGASLLDLASAAMVENGGQMKCGEIIECVKATGKWSCEGKTPAATLHSALMREIKTKGEQSRFEKFCRGHFQARKEA